MPKPGALKTWILLLVVFAFVIAYWRFGEATPKDLAAWLIPVIGTYLGAAYGASYAFKLQEGKDDESEKRVQVDALNRALMVMCFQYNDIAATWTEMRKFNNGELVRMLTLPAFKSPQFDYRQNVLELAFLMENNDPNLLLEIAIEQGRFDSCIESMKIRAEYFVKKVEPLIEKYGIRSKNVISEQLVFDAFGERVYGTLRNNTNALYEQVEQSERTLFETLCKLHVAAKRSFPSTRFFKVQRVDFNASALATPMAAQA